jgi:hypothetical protein
LAISFSWVWFVTTRIYTRFEMRILSLATFLVTVLATRLLVLARFFPTLIESDEAIVGLMARHILKGEFPIFYWGQSHMGTFEAYLTAGMFVLFGPSALVLKLTVLTLFLLFLAAHFKLAEEVSESRFVAWMATISVGISPAFLTVWSLKSRGGYMSLLLFGTLSLLLAARLVKNDSHRRVTILLLGASTGVAFWSHFAAVTYAIPIGLILLWKFRATLLRYAWVGVIGFLVGSSPVWIYNFLHHFASASQPVARRTTIIEDFQNIFGTGLPILLGGRAPWSPNDGYLPYLGVFVVLVFLGAFGWMVAGQLKAGNPSVCLLLLFAFMYPLFVSAGGVGFFMLEPRYLFPLYSVCYIILFMALPRVGPKLGMMALIISLNLYGSFTLRDDEFIIPGYTQPMEALIEFLKSEDVMYAYAPYWIAYRLSFESNEDIVASPPPGDHIRYGPYDVAVKSNKPVAYIRLHSSDSNDPG